MMLNIAPSGSTSRTGPRPWSGPFRQSADCAQGQGGGKGVDSGGGVPARPFTDVGLLASNGNIARNGNDRQRLRLDGPVFENIRRIHGAHRLCARGDGFGAIREHGSNIGGICSRLEIASCLQQSVASAPEPRTPANRNRRPEQGHFGRPTTEFVMRAGDAACAGRGLALRWGIESVALCSVDNSGIPPAGYALGSLPTRRLRRSGRASSHPHRTLQRPGEYQRQPEAPDGGQAPGHQRTDGGGAPHEAAPRAADPSHEIGRGEPLTERDGDDRPRSDRQTDHGEGGAGQLPAMGRCHDQVADAGDERGADQGLAVSESADHPVRPQAPDEGPSRTGGQEDPVGTFPTPHTLVVSSTRMPASIPWRPASEPTIKSRSRSRRSAKRSRTPSQAEVEAPSGRGAFERKPTRGMQDNSRDNGIGEKGDRLADGEEPCADHGSGEVLRRPPRCR